MKHTSLKGHIRPLPGNGSSTFESIFFEGISQLYNGIPELSRTCGNPDYHLHFWVNRCLFVYLHINTRLSMLWGVYWLAFRYYHRRQRGFVFTGFVNLYRYVCLSAAILIKLQINFYELCGSGKLWNKKHPNIFRDSGTFLLHIQRHKIGHTKEKERKVKGFNVQFKSWLNQLSLSHESNKKMKKRKTKQKRMSN